MEDVPVIVIEKVKNAGKKDSLVLCHDLFNYPRENSPLYTKLLRKEIWDGILPELTKGEEFSGFNMVFCTDADSTIYKGAVALLANALARDKDAIAACGLVLVELEPGYEWSFWNLYQQFQVCSVQYRASILSPTIFAVHLWPICQKTSRRLHWQSHMSPRMHHHDRLPTRNGWCNPQIFRACHR